MKLLTSNLDEMLEQETAKTETIALYLTATALTLTTLAQATMGVPFQQFFGEFIILEALCLYMTIMSLKNGVWDRFFNPGKKCYFVGSLIAATIVSLFVLVMNLLYGPLYNLFQDILIWFGCTFGSCYIGLTFLGMVCKKRRKKLDQDPGYQELAREIGVTVQTLKAIERGTFNPSIKLCRKICEVTGKTLDDLFGDERKKIMIKI
jgi:putative transcriptional regulator